MSASPMRSPMPTGPADSAESKASTSRVSDVGVEWNTSLYGQSPSPRAITLVCRNQAHNNSGPTR